MGRGIIDMSTTEKPEPSIAMLELRRERAKDRIFGVIIVVLMICWTFSMYMFFSYFANTTQANGRGVDNSVTNTSGDNNHIE